ncbi:SDR family NAD(P)-dependent oxidoreductase [Frigoribacterium sp. CFBP 13729]|uniref:SDR family NAD(P)-dependent oxidoreductase n=1 Tax=unclassified Frigoribacterium TaxID=2627005 RepID=UPI00177D5113|nr:SDR family NAD(P)-dependent oxidoreductase [Frigoribacterium sp. CFBP 8766]MBD8611907.1 SDR family NAD(P)-dependent oxidoreductase [Frigoribacterium sp. CFBP 13729]
MTTRDISTFGATTTAAETLEGVDLGGRTALVTGASSGIGVETARALAGAGARVTLAVRDVAAGRAVADDIARTTGGPAPDVVELHLDRPASVGGVAAAWTGPLDILVANAGVMDSPETYTAAGWELQFATNHLGHFALALGLHGALAAAGGARVVSVSSSGNGGSPVVFDDLFFRRRRYEPGLAYAQSKTANALFAVGASARWADDGIVANSCMPGGIWTGLQKHWDPDVLAATKVAAADAVKTPEQGAATSVLLATAPELAEVRGRYYEDCHEAEVVDEIVDGLHGVRAWALDPAQADRLWDVSLALVDTEARSRASGTPAPHEGAPS